MSYLILVRHGESRWNKSNRFTGWVDVPLSNNGVKEALACGLSLCDLKLDRAYTSNLRRTQETLLLILAEQYRTGVFLHNNEKNEKKYSFSRKLGVKDIPIHSSALLNERCYGDLQGMNKKEARKRYGQERVFQWRRGFRERPPEGESLLDVSRRVLPYFKKNIATKIAKDNIILSLHGNTLRVLIKYLENIPEESIPHLELPYGHPIIYKYSKGKFHRMNFMFEFNRPISWENIGQKNKTQRPRLRSCKKR